MDCGSSDHDHDLKAPPLPPAPVFAGGWLLG